MPIEQFRGVGKKTIPKMHELGVFKGADLLKLSENDLIHHFGKFGYTLYRRVRGQDDRPVAYQRERNQSVKKKPTANPW
jgi:Nucleotidyltransferase/DNA polymerase involved in DNA repair